jgi:hypothetical protein
MKTEAKVLIAYPIDFLSFEKFERKVKKIISSLEKAELIYFADDNNFIKKYAEANELASTKYEKETDTVLDATHAFIFQDEERNCFFNLFLELRKKNTPIRITNLKLTKVSNRDNGEKYDVYIGRGTLWGNPYQMGKEGTREEVIEKFAYDFKRRFLKLPDKFDENIEKLRGKTLGCHCKPAACHGDVIANYLNAQDDGE